MDISFGMVRRAIEKTEEAGLKNAVSYTQMAAESVAHRDSVFDRVVGDGVLHHIDVRRTLDEVERVLKPGGQAVFVEPMGHNPLINLFRFLTPWRRTPDEHPLKHSDLVVMQQRSVHCECEYFHLLTLLYLPLRVLIPGTTLRNRVLNKLHRIDQRLVRLWPWLSRYFWIVVVRLKKEDADGG